MGTSITGERNPTLYKTTKVDNLQHQPSTLVVWGKNDKFFTQEGTLAYKRDLKNIEVHFLDSGHFALEEEYSLISNYISAFFGKAETVHIQRE